MLRANRDRNANDKNCDERHARVQENLVERRALHLPLFFERVFRPDGEEHGVGSDGSGLRCGKKDGEDDESDHSECGDGSNLWFWVYVGNE